MKTRTPFDRHNLRISHHDKVVEIGSGHEPMYRSDVIVEKYIDNNYHRCGDVKIYPHQRFVNADGESLPFANREFDYAISNQVLEHAEHPDRFIGELARVASRGYIETPSLIGEYLFPKKSHKWVILDIDGTLVFYEKALLGERYQHDYGELFLNYLPYQSLPYKMLWYTEGALMLNRYEWNDGIDFLINPTDDFYRSFFTEPWTREMTEYLFPPRSLSHELKQAFTAIGQILKYKMRQRSHTENKLITIEDYMTLHS
jgi:SAM-dependent methyltransferase